MHPYDEDNDDDPIEAYDDNQLDVVTFCEDNEQAESIQELLADHGITVEIDEEGLFGDEGDGVALLAAGIDVEEARTVLERLDLIEEISIAEADEEVEELDDDEDEDDDFEDEDDDDLLGMDDEEEEEEDSYGSDEDDEDDYPDDDEDERY